jgi:hypothetical protein
MRWLVFVLLLAGCGSDSLSVSNDGGAQVLQPDAEADAALEKDIIAPDYTPPPADGALRSVGPEAGECPADDTWTFINHSVWYCGSLPDACMYVCGVRDGCSGGDYHGALLVAYCPGDKP